jgi:large subunit ribosomal protein L22
MSATKARQVVDMIRGYPVDDARRMLQFTNRAATAPVAKVLESAIANAEHNRSLPADELMVARAWVDEGPTLRRFRPRAMGRATRVNKRTCHISVVVGRMEEVAAPEPRRRLRRGGKKTEEQTSRRRATAKKTAARRVTAKKATARKSSKKTTAKKTTEKKTTAKRTTARGGRGNGEDREVES